MHRKIAVPVLALALIAGLTGCGFLGAEADDASPGSSVPSDSECALLQTALESAQKRAETLAQKLQTDVPGAIEDINTTINEFQALAAELPDGQLKSQINKLVTQGEELRAILEESQRNGANGFTVIAQASSKLGEITETLELVRKSCSFTQ